MVDAAQVRTQPKTYLSRARPGACRPLLSLTEPVATDLPTRPLLVLPFARAASFVCLEPPDRTPVVPSPLVVVVRTRLAPDPPNRSLRPIRCTLLFFLSLVRYRCRPVIKSCADHSKFVFSASTWRRFHRGRLHFITPTSPLSPRHSCHSH